MQTDVLDEVESVEKELQEKSKLVAMLAPSFVVNFDYPEIIDQLRRLGFDKVVELTFGAKMVNLEYHKLLKKTDKLLISTACPGLVDTIKREFPQYEKNLIRVYSPMVATALICKKIYPKHKTVFISPCNFKKMEAKSSPNKCVDFVIDCAQLQALFEKNNIKPRKSKIKHTFDKFYNDYTKIYPTSGGLSKTAHVRGVLKEEEAKIIDGVVNVREFLKNPDKKIKFLDSTFCIGSCIGGPLLTRKLTLGEKKKRVLKYVTRSLHESISVSKKGIVKDAKGIKFDY
jgi:iron only hydrogenase large subunit-like protein